MLPPIFRRSFTQPHSIARLACNASFGFNHGYSEASIELESYSQAPLLLPDHRPFRLQRQTTNAVFRSFWERLSKEKNFPLIKVEEGGYWAVGSGPTGHDLLGHKTKAMSK
jgi:hypothetical protein